MYKVVITGPESSGKSTLSQKLANHFHIDFVKEYSRDYLTELGRAYNQQDLTEIAKGQIIHENKVIESGYSYVICDTSLEVIKIWSEFKFNYCDPFIIKSLAERLPDLYLLMVPDIPWTPDPLRENPTNREELFILYKNELIKSKVPFYEISGNESKRFGMAKEVIYKSFEKT